MSAEPKPLSAGLYFVATPIGSARDITLRALDILGATDVLAAEDTRSLRRLMEMHGVALRNRRILAYHDHNGPRMRPRLMQALSEGKSVAYASEAGTPLVADPGYQLAKEAADAGYPVTTAPGASAVLAALTVAALPTDRFLFAGFPPATKGARLSWLSGLRDIPATLVIYDSPKRVARLLSEAAETLGPDRQAAVCRELTKRFEEVRRGSLAQLAAELAEVALKGEIVLVVDKGGESAGEQDIEGALAGALKDMSLKDAAATVAEAFGLARRDVYQTALRMRERR